MYSTNNHKSGMRTLTGMTLIELLVVISILGILTAILVPRMRIVNKDRNIREAARIVASVFASASQRAVNEGVSGVLIERNGNIVDGAGNQYAGTVLYVARRLPPYVGDSAADMATNFDAANRTLEIPTPYEYGELGTAENDPVRVNDQISFNYSSVKYRIEAINVTGMTMELRLVANAGLPPLPNAFATLPFIVHRQPRRLESSRTVLPEGYIIDMRVSGEFYDDGTNVLPYFHPLFGVAPAGVRFNSGGGVDHLYYEGAMSQFHIPNQNQYLLIREYDPENQTTDDSLSNPSNLWVSIGAQTGAANVANITPIDPSAGGTLGVKIAIAQGIATQQISSDQ